MPCEAQDHVSRVESHHFHLLQASRFADENLGIGAGGSHTGVDQGSDVWSFGVEALEFRVKIRPGSSDLFSLPDAKHTPKVGWEFEAQGSKFGGWALGFSVDRLVITPRRKELPRRGHRHAVDLG